MGENTCSSRTDINRQLTEKKGDRERERQREREREKVYVYRVWNGTAKDEERICNEKSVSEPNEFIIIIIIIIIIFCVCLKLCPSYRFVILLNHSHFTLRDGFPSSPHHHHLILLSVPVFLVFKTWAAYTYYPFRISVGLPAIVMCIYRSFA